MSSDPDPGAHARRARYARSQHRAHSHDSAHDADQDTEPAPKVTHPLAPKGHATLITSQPALADLIDHLRGAGSFAYDSEFIGELTYVPKLCLIQVSSRERVALVDPLAGLDLRPFWELIADPSLEKIVHAGQQDIEPVFRNIGKPAANVFDTQIACGFIGMAYPVSLGKLVQELTGTRLGKGLTFSHWDQRPLSPMQLRYAADDVRYLPAVRDEIRQRLGDGQRAAWAKEESESLCEPTQYQFNPDTYFHRVRGASSLHAQGLAILRELTIWRDRVARAHDVPPRAFLKDEILVDLARQPVKSVDKLARVRGLPRPVEQANGAEIVEATLQALSTPASSMPAPRTFEPTPTERFRADAVWAAAQALCIGQSIDPALVTSRQEIGEFHRTLTKRGDVEESSLMKGWRRQALGEPLLKLLTSGGHIDLEWANGSLRAATTASK
jgi:ribonuclease D